MSADLHRKSVSIAQCRGVQGGGERPLNRPGSDRLSGCTNSRLSRDSATEL